jgi:hypothetical protein
MGAPFIAQSHRAKGGKARTSLKHYRLLRNIFSTNMGAPGLDFQTWESKTSSFETKQEHGCPILRAASSREGSESTNLTEACRLLQGIFSTNMGAPGLDFETWESKAPNPE